MAYNWQVVGHNKQKEFLAKIGGNSKLAHAYVFAGPAGIGKYTLASNFAKNLLCESNSACGMCVQCKAFDAKINADFIELKQNETFKIEQIRHLIYQLSLKPYQAKYKIAVIDAAENMTVEATNALLKSLEEPKPYTILILITANPYRLLPTILSRAQKINFGLVQESEYESLLPQDLSVSQKLSLKTFAAGRPGLAKQISSAPEVLEKLEQFAARYQIFANGDITEKIQLSFALAENEDSDIKDLLHFWLQNLEKELSEHGSQGIAKKITSVSEAILQIDANVNTKLLLTQLMVQ